MSERPTRWKMSLLCVMTTLLAVSCQSTGDSATPDTQSVDAVGPDITNPDTNSPDTNSPDAAIEDAVNTDAAQGIDVQAGDTGSSDAGAADTNTGVADTNTGVADTNTGAADTSNGADTDGYDPAKPPTPFPKMSDEPAAACAKALKTPDYFQFLDNLCDEKVDPAFASRSLACPVVDDSAVTPLKGGGQASYVPYDQPQPVDTAALKGLLPAGTSMSVILIKRVKGVPHLRVLGTADHAKPMQPWSTTKWMAAANAAVTMRVQSGYKVGLTAKAKGYDVGDMVSSVHTYDYSPYSSNGLGRWFHDIGGRKQANDMIHEKWLKRPASETFGGNYGAKAPPLGYSFVEASGDKLTVSPDPSSGPANNLSMYTLTLALERVVLHREQAKTRMPGLQWKDIEVLLYGAKGSKKYGPFGGMSADTAIYAQAGVDIQWVAKRSQGKWRVHSKLGLGTKGQFIWVGYACLPWLDSAGQPIPGWGREMVIAAHLGQGGKNWRERDRLLATGIRKVMLRVLDGRL